MGYPSVSIICEFISVGQKNQGIPFSGNMIIGDNICWLVGM